LEYMQSQGFKVRIANLESGRAVTLSATSSSYHPKVYAATSGTSVHIVVGSANLTRRALTVNTEAVATQRLTNTDFKVQWDHLVENSVPLTQSLLDEYKMKRPKRRLAFPPDEPRVPVPPPAPMTLPTFREEVEVGRLQPENYQAFWVQVGGPSGEAGNQVELPRCGNRFFAYDFEDYDLRYVVQIGEPLLRNAGRTWHDRKLTWHGDNRMERLNLPTRTMSGLTYSNRVVLFHRCGVAFDLTVADFASPVAQSWVDESAASGLIFRFGPNSNRLCGLF
jgi:hypothetical protein